MTHETLHVVSGPATGQELHVDAELVIGREAPGPGRLADDLQLSRRHARLYRTPDGALAVEDLGSTNGTRVNDAVIAAPTLLRPGDRVQLGGTLVEVRAAAAPRPVPLPASPTPALGPLPAIGRAEAAVSNGNRRQLVFAALLVLLVGAAVAAVAMSGDGGDSSASPPAIAPAADKSFDGTVYVESNDYRKNAGSVLAFRYRRGSLRPLSMREYPTGGSGSHDLSNAGVLDAEQQIVTNASRTLLFTVNTGTDTIAVFHIAADGTLTPVKGSPFPSLGKAPASVGVSGNELFVANKAQDGIRKLKTTAANYATFRIGSDGTLTPLGTPVEAPPRSSPTETYVPPHTGHLMIATEESGPFRAFTIGADGQLTQAEGSPHDLDAAVFGKKKRPDVVWPQGLIAHPKLPLIYAGVANIRKLVVYEYDAAGKLTYVSSQINKGSFLPCWTEINKAGTRLYTGNAGSQNISVYDIAKDPRHPKQIQRVKLHGQGLPWNFQLDPTGRYLFMVNMRAVSDIPPGKGNTLHSFAIGSDGKLKELSSSPVPIPVPLGTNPWGLVVVPRR
jgi:DNA-binding beta-propeller fold protein YncE